MKRFKNNMKAAQGFSNQQAVLLLVILFPLGLISIGSLSILWLRQPSTDTQSPSKHENNKPDIPQADNMRQHEYTTTPPQNKSQEQRLNDLADEIFWRRHPSLRGEKLSQQTGDLAREWSQIRRCEAIVDDRFYRIYPHMRGRTIQATQTRMALTWQRLRDQVEGCS